MPSIEEILDTIPPSPGVYLMKDAEGKILYVGKALSLRSRVRQYFRDGSGDTRASVRILRNRVVDIETIVTDTENEAFLLENTLIKKHRPRYNIRLRDDKTYISLRLDTEHEWPRVHKIRRRIPGDKALYFGPYSSGLAVKETLRFLQKLFPLRSCPDSVLRNRSRPCVLHQIGRCCAPCVGRVDKPRYEEYVKETILFLNGKQEEVVKLLQQKMMELSEDMQFEKAAQVRDKIRAIAKTMEQEKVAGHRLFDRDVIAMARDQGRAVFAILFYRGGLLSETRALDLKDPGFADDELMEAFLGQFYDENNKVPRDILVSAEPANPEITRAGLEAIRRGAVRLVAPQRGGKARLVAMAATNARNELDRRLAGEKSREAVLRNLQENLHLDREPRRIECFDISNFQGTFAVGSMTSFLDGQPDKANYRHFKIKTVEGQNDFAAMREVLSRRYGRLLKENLDLPDLVVIDGGKGQLNIAVEVFAELGLTSRVPVCGLAKSRLLPSKLDGMKTKVRTEERVFLPNRKLPILFDQSDPALFILTRIRDEAHRFGITYHRKLRSKASLRSGLEDLPGIGPKRRKALLQHFGSLARLKAATREELAAVPALPPAVADYLWNHLHRPVEEKAKEVEELYEEEGDGEGDDEGAELIEDGEEEGPED